jgi:hypothetical protein
MGQLRLEEQPVSRHPPRWLDACVGALVPSACRDTILGDLTELYRSPDTLGFSAVRSVYRRNLEQRCQTARTYLGRYVLCLLVGPAILAVDTALQQPAVWTVASSTLAGVAAMAALLVWMGQRARNRLLRRIEQLASVREKP